MSVPSKCAVCNRHMGFYVEPNEIVFCISCECMHNRKQNYLEDQPEIFLDDNGYYWRQKL